MNSKVILFHLLNSCRRAITTKMRELHFEKMLRKDKDKAIAEMTDFLNQEACPSCNPVYYNTYALDHPCCSGLNDAYVSAVINKFVQRS